MAKKAIDYKKLKAVMAWVERKCAERYDLDELSVFQKDAVLEIQAKARAFAPVDTGGLEEAIKIDKMQVRDAKGRFGKVVHYCYIDPNMINSEGRRVQNYARLVHEWMEYDGRAGSIKLGPKSREKKKRTGENVGGMFMTRAIREALKNQGGDPISIYSGKLNNATVLKNRYKSGKYNALTFDKHEG